jgi:heptosyltransferase-2
MHENRRKILIIRFGSLGDLILMTPLLRGLRETAPEAWIHVACKERYGDIFAGNTAIDRVFMLREGGPVALLRLWSRLRDQHYDCVIDAHNVIRSRILYRLIPAPRKVTIEKEHAKKVLLIRRKVNLYDRIVPQSERYRQLGRRLGLDIPDLPTELTVPASADGRIEELLVEAGIAWKPVVAVAPGARWPTKRWPVDHYIELIGAMSERGIATVLIGGEDESTLGAAITARRSGAVDLTGRLSILETAAALRRCDCLVSNDSAPLHIAEAVGTPVVALFGPTVREFGYYPQLSDSVALEVDLECRPCSRNGARPCPLGTTECLSAIAPARVLAAVERLLGTPGTVPSPTDIRSHQ